MAPNSSATDWETLKPKILRLLSAGRTRKDVIDEISRDGSSITKSQLEYQLKCWGRRTNLSEQAWRYTNHKVQKRTSNKKVSAVFFNGALIPYGKVVKETRRHDRPSLLPAPGGNPKCPEGFDLVICTPPSSASPPCEWKETFTEAQYYPLGPTGMISLLPWVIFAHELRRNFVLTSESSAISILRAAKRYLPTQPQSAAILSHPPKVHQPCRSVEELEMSVIPQSEFPASNQDAELEVVTHRTLPCDAQVFHGLERLAFQISNKISTGNTWDDNLRLFYFGKIVVGTGLSCKDLLPEVAGATSKSLIEQLFALSIIGHDPKFAEMLLQAGADPNQEILNLGPGKRYSALELVVKQQHNDTMNILLNSGAVCTQMALKCAILVKDLETADRMLQSDSSLDVDSNYVDSLDTDTIRYLGHLKLETVTLTGLLCLDACMNVGCECDRQVLCETMNHMDGCRINNIIGTMRYLLTQGTRITLDTMILASYSVDIVTLQFLLRHGGNVCGFNNFGFSCLAAASMRTKLQHTVFVLLLCSGATIDVPQNHRAFGLQASPFHYLCFYSGANERYRSQIPMILDLLIESGGSINYCVRHACTPSELDEIKQRFLWCQPCQWTSPVVLIAQAGAESPLEYAIIAGNEDAATGLISRGFHPGEHEVKLAVKFGLLSLFKSLLNHSSGGSGGEAIGRTCLRLALRWGHETIVQFLLGEGLQLAEQDIIDALQYPGMSILSTATQIDLINATPDLDRRKIFGLPLLELCCLKFSPVAVWKIIEQFPAAYDSGMLAVIVLRVLRENNAFCIEHIQDMIGRRTERNLDWRKENTALLIAAMFNRPEILRILVTPGANCVMKSACLSQEDLSWILSDRVRRNPYFRMDPTRNLGCQKWVSCSPLIGIATAPRSWYVSEAILDHLLACCYEPDAFTVVVAAAKGHSWLLRRLQHLENWRNIVSIDNNDRPPWCPTALQVAVSYGNEEVVRLLLDADVSVNELPADEPMENILPRTALQAAIDKRSLSLTNLFLERGACINAPAAANSGATALQLACIHGQLEISLRLLKLGADVNAAGALKRGRTALEGAAEHGRIDTIQLLLNHGACTDGSYRAQYLKAIVYAENNRHFAAAALLREHREWHAEDEECYESILSHKLYDEYGE